MPIECISKDNKVLAMVIREKPPSQGVRFFTPDDYSLQVGKHFHRGGTVIKPHCHFPVKVTKNASLNEVLYIEKGKVKVNFYTKDGGKIDSVILNSGDLILLMEGGHGFEFLEETKMIEIKEGPFIAESKKKIDVKK